MSVNMNDMNAEMFWVMLTGQDNTGEWDIAELQRGYTVDGKGFGVHGNDSQGRWDIEFPTMFEAFQWYLTWRSDLSEFNVRKGDSVTDLNTTVVMTVMPKVKLTRDH